MQSGDGLRQVALRSRSRSARTQAVLVVGPPGYDCVFVFMSMLLLTSAIVLVKAR